MNTAVLMFSACLAGAGPAPVAPAPAYPQIQPAPVVVATPGRASVGDCCGHASVCGDCDGHAKKCCILDKIKEKLSCFHIDLCGKGNKGNHGCNNGCDHGHKSFSLCNKGNNGCDNGHKCFSLCNKGNHNACPQPCAQPAPVCNPCPKPAPVCCKTQPVCHDACAKPCWTPGYFLHKCKEKLCGICDKKDACHGGCGTAATPNGCGSTVIPPATGTAPAVVPVAPAQPDVRKIPATKVGSAYPMVTPTVTPASAPRTIDLGGNPL